jgi:hypothetical protein
MSRRQNLLFNEEERLESNEKEISRLEEVDLELLENLEALLKDSGLSREELHSVLSHEENLSPKNQEQLAELRKDSKSSGIRDPRQVKKAYADLHAMRNALFVR